MKAKTIDYCPRCKRQHHVFYNSPSMVNKVALCGQAFTQDGKVVKRGAK